MIGRSSTYWSTGRNRRRPSGERFPARGGCDEAEIGGDELAAGLEDAGGFGDGRPEVRDIYPDDVADDGRSTVEEAIGKCGGRGPDDGALAS